MSTPAEERQLSETMAKWMRAKLSLHSDRPHWKRTDQNFLIGRLRAEVEELAENPSWEEAADVANFAAMVADNAEGRSLTHGQMMVADILEEMLKDEYDPELAALAAWTVFTHAEAEQEKSE